ncbi:hypothetical protein ACQ4PT_033815 [Festuca glaucescens]
MAKKRKQGRGDSSRRSARDAQPVAQDPHLPVGGVRTAADGSRGSYYLSDPISSISTRRSARVSSRDLNFEQRFRRYLHGHCEGIADNMWDSNTFEMQLHFYTIRASHKLLSDEIVRNHKNMKAELKAALVDYLKVQFTKKPYAKKYADLDDMVHKIRLHSKLTFLDVPDTSIDHLLQNHKEGKSWGGAWTREDWVIIDGIPCLHAAGEPANQLIGDAQTAERSDETDLYAEDQFPYVLAQLIKTLFSNNRMVGEFLEHYEDFKKLRGNSNNEVHPEDVEGSELEGTGSA